MIRAELLREHRFALPLEASVQAVLDAFAASIPGALPDERIFAGHPLVPGDYVAREFRVYGRAEGARSNDQLLSQVHADGFTGRVIPFILMMAMVPRQIEWRAMFLPGEFEVMRLVLAVGYHRFDRQSMDVDLHDGHHVYAFKRL